MKIIRNILLSGLLMASLTSFAQPSFSHSLGASFYIGGDAAAPGATYSPRINLVGVGDEMTVSVGTHLGLGFMYNSQSGGSFALDLPLVAEVNFGHASSEDATANFGGFLGIGVGISKIGSAGAFGGSYNDAAGFLVNGGLKAYIRDRSVGFRFAYLLNGKQDEITGEDYANVITLGLMYNFGM